MKQVPQNPLSFLSVVLLQDVVRPSQITSGGAPRGVGVEAQPVIRLSEVNVVKNEEEK